MFNTKPKSLNMFVMVMGCLFLIYGNELWIVWCHRNKLSTIKILMAQLFVWYDAEKIFLSEIFVDLSSPCTHVIHENYKITGKCIKYYRNVETNAFYLMQNL